MLKVRGGYAPRDKEVKTMTEEPVVQSFRKKMPENRRDLDLEQAEIRAKCGMLAREILERRKSKSYQPYRKGNE